MKLLCDKKNLVNAVNIVQKAVISKSSVPLLEGILIEAKDKLKLTGNSFELGIECFAKAEIIERGSVVVNSKVFGEIIRKLPNSQISIEVKENFVVKINCENSKFEITGINPKGFPVFPEIEQKSAVLVSHKTLRDMIKQTIFAVSLDNSRPVLTGSLLESNNGEFKIVSIDGFRLALRNTVIDDKSDFRVIVPRKSLNEILKILQSYDEDNDEVKIVSSGNQIILNLGDCKVFSGLIEGEFMNYKNLIPGQFSTIVKIDTKKLLETMDRASVITYNNNKYPIKFNIRNQILKITMNTKLINFEEILNIDQDGEDLEIGFNSIYFVDALRVIEDEEIKLMFTSPIGPCVISPVDGNHFNYINLPVMINN